MKLKPLILTLALIAGLAGSAHATAVGYATSSAGYAFLDTFASASFTDGAATSADVSDFSATFTVASGMPTGAGDRVYDFGAASSFTVNGVAAADLDTLVFQIKFSTPATVDAADLFNVSASFAGGFTQTLSGTETITTGGGGVTTYFIYAWTWTGLDLTNSDTFTITATNTVANQHVSVDGVRLDAAAVPEPSAFAVIAGFGVLGLAVTRRRRA